jgi:hypothetical protein
MAACRPVSCVYSDLSLSALGVRVTEQNRQSTVRLHQIRLEAFT